MHIKSILFQHCIVSCSINSNVVKKNCRLRDTLDNQVCLLSLFHCNLFKESMYVTYDQGPLLHAAALESVVHTKTTYGNVHDFIHGLSDETIEKQYMKLS